MFPPVCFLILRRAQLVLGCGGARSDSPNFGREIALSRRPPHPLSYHPGAVTLASVWTGGDAAARAVTALAISCDLRIPWMESL